jgi:hypothetical protein
MCQDRHVVGSISFKASLVILRAPRGGVFLQTFRANTHV